jgi:hypothetical protein
MKATNARIHDLIAKTSRVTIKDTLRVMLTLRIIADYMDCSIEELLEIPHDLTRATPEQAEACQKEFQLMCKQLNQSGRGNEIKVIRAID